MTKKIFDRYSISHKDLRALIVDFAKSLGVKRVTFSNKARYVRGTYNAFTGSLFLDLTQTNIELLHTFFHELGHHMAVKQNRMMGYHYCTVPSMTFDQIFKAENKVDRIGEKLWYKYVDVAQWGKYKYSYPKSQKTNIIKNFLNR
jgi:hypothetical protein